MKILLNKSHFPVRVLGPGTRVGLWLQGCTIHCFGCISRDTWPADKTKAVEVDAILDWVRALPADDVDGVTISGGEPLDQPDALSALLSGLDEWRNSLGHSVDFLCYSGRGWKEVQRDFAVQLALLDAIVPEPFVQGEQTRQALRGSANQRVIPLTALGRERYSAEALTGDLAEQRAQVQLAVDGEAVRFIGIPQQGDMSALRDAARERGVMLERTSWLI